MVIANLACDSDPNSKVSITFHWLALARVSGFQVGEYAQTTQNKVDEHKYASGNKVVKAFISSDWKFYDVKGCLTTIHSLDGLVDLPRKVKLAFRMQINCQIKFQLPPSSEAW